VCVLLRWVCDCQKETLPNFAFVKIKKKKKLES
jgi:hypothetical protein